MKESTAQHASTRYIDVHGNTLRWTSHPWLASECFIPVNRNGQYTHSKFPKPRKPEQVLPDRQDGAASLDSTATDYTLAMLARDIAEADRDDPMLNPYLRAWGDETVSNMLPDWEAELLEEDRKSPRAGEMVMRLGVVIGEVACDGTTDYFDHSNAAPRAPRKRKRLDRCGLPIKPPYVDELLQRPLGRTTDLAEQAAYVLKAIDSQDDELARDTARIRTFVSLLKRYELDIRRIDASIAELKQRPELLDYQAQYQELSSKESYLGNKLLEARENGDYSSETVMSIDTQVRDLRAQLAILERVVYVPTIQPIEEQIAKLNRQKFVPKQEKARATRQLKRLIKTYKHLTGDYEYNASGKLVRVAAPQEHGSASASHRPSRSRSKSSEARDVRYFTNKHKGSAYEVGDEDGVEPYDIPTDDFTSHRLQPHEAAELGVPVNTVWPSLEPFGRGGTELVYGSWDHVPELDFLLEPDGGNDPVAYMDGHGDEKSDFGYEGDGFHITYLR